MAILAQGYVHLKSIRTRENISATGNQIWTEANRAARDLYGASVGIEVRINEGSYKVYATVILGLYTAVSQYSDFKTGVNELYKDGKRFGESIIEIVSDTFHASPTQIYRAERRSKSSGKLYRIMKRIERINNNAGILTEKVLSDEISAVYTELNKLMKGLDEDELNLILEKMPMPIIPKKSGETKRMPFLRPKQLDLIELPSVKIDDSSKTLYLKSNSGAGVKKLR